VSRFFSGVIVLGAFVILMAFQNCGGKPSGSSQNGGDPSNSNVIVTGTIMAAQQECTNKLICSTDNLTGKQSCFLPINMDPTLLNTGNVVTVTGVIRTDIVNVCLGSTLDVSSAQLVSGSTVPPLAQ